MTTYRVIGRYSHEQHRHEISRHRSLAAAWRRAHREHYALGGVAGGNMLAAVEARLDDDLAAQVRASMAGMGQDPYRCLPGTDIAPCHCTVEDDGVWADCDYFRAHVVAIDGGALVARVRSDR